MLSSIESLAEEAKRPSRPGQGGSSQGHNVSEPGGQRGTPWAIATKNVKKPLGEKDEHLKYQNVTWTQSDLFDFLNVHPFSARHLLESNMCK